MRVIINKSNRLSRRHINVFIVLSMSTFINSYADVAQSTPSTPSFQKEVKDFVEGPPSPQERLSLKKLITPAQEQLETCGDCHPDHVEGFKQTHMSRAMSKPYLSEVIEDFSPHSSTIIHPKTGVGYRSYIDDQGRWWQEEFDPQGTYKRAVEVKYLIGSGNNTRSYIGEIQGELVELPLTWYSRTQERSGLWDMSPGYQRKDHFRFKRPIKGDCLFCHNDLGKINDQRLSSFIGELPSGITCVRCHGDGEAHITSRFEGIEPEIDQPDPTIFNPKHLSSARQHQICEQCHLAGEARALLPGQRWDEYNPRVPLEDYFRIYAFPLDKNVHPQLNATEDFGIASHAERMKLSACSKKSDHFTCTTCHNPHKPDTPNAYQNACLTCHQDNQHLGTMTTTNLTCSSTHSSSIDEAGKDTSKRCYECHMKLSGTSDIPHVQMTDHWIRRSIKSKDLSEQGKAPASAPIFSDKLISLLPSLSEKNKSYEQGLLGLAYADLVRFNGKGELAPRALNLLVSAVKIHPNWSELWSKIAEMSQALKDDLAALGAYQKYASFKPNDEYYRLKQVGLLLKRGDLSKAEVILTALIKARPSNYQAYEQLGNLNFQQNKYSKAEFFYKKADSFAQEEHSLPHNLGFLSLIQGKLKQARTHFNEGIRRDGVSREGPFFLGLLEAAEKNYSKATQLIYTALKRDPSYHIAYQQLARILHESGDSEQSIQVLKQWTNQHPKHVDAYLILIQYLDQQGLYPEVYRTLKRAVTLSNDPRLHKALEISKDRLRLSRGKIDQRP